MMLGPALDLDGEPRGAELGEASIEPGTRDLRRLDLGHADTVVHPEVHRVQVSGHIPWLMDRAGALAQQGDQRLGAIACSDVPPGRAVVTREDLPDLPDAFRDVRVIERRPRDAAR